MMTNNKMNRKSFLKMIGLGAAVPFIPKLPFGIGERLQPKRDTIPTLRHENVGTLTQNIGPLIDYEAERNITKGEAIHTDEYGVIGIALDDANAGETVKILTQGVFTTSGDFYSA